MNIKKRSFTAAQKQGPAGLCKIQDGRPCDFWRVKFPGRGFFSFKAGEWLKGFPSSC
jgi:hypothetical protein